MGGEAYICEMRLWLCGGCIWLCRWGYAYIRAVLGYCYVVLYDSYNIRVMARVISVGCG